MNSQSGEKYYAATVILPRDKKEKQNAALRIKKRMNTAAKLKTMSNNTTRQRYKQRKYRKITAKVPEFREIKESTAGIK
jgi:hypothetical protein